MIQSNPPDPMCPPVSTLTPHLDDPYAPGGQFTTRKTLEENPTPKPETGELDPAKLVNGGEVKQPEYKVTDEPTQPSGDNTKPSVTPSRTDRKEEWMESELEKLKREAAEWEASRDWTDSVEDIIALLDPMLESIIQMVSWQKLPPVIHITHVMLDL